MVQLIHFQIFLIVQFVLLNTIIFPIHFSGYFAKPDSSEEQSEGRASTPSVLTQQPSQPNVS